MENKQPIISIIVPVYNVEEYLPSCLKSIQNQTFTDFECILINDGSTDESGEICDIICQKDNRFKVIHQKNKGYQTARNTGLNIANGKYIYFIDSDDYVHCQILETLYKAITESNSSLAMVYGKSVYNHDINDTTYSTKNEYMILPQNVLIQNLFSNSETDLQYQVVWNKLYSKDLLKNIRFINTASEDTFFNLEVYLQVDKLALIQTELYYWYQHSTSITHQGINKRFIDVISTYHNCYKYIPTDKYHYKAYCIYKLYKRIFNIRYYTRNTPYEKYAIDKISNIKKDTWKDIWSNKELSFSRKLIITSMYHIPLLYNLFMWYNNRK